MTIFKFIGWLVPARYDAQRMPAFAAPEDAWLLTYHGQDGVKAHVRSTSG